MPIAHEYAEQRLLVELYRAAREMPVAAFPDHALSLIARTFVDAPSDVPQLAHQASVDGLEARCDLRHIGLARMQRLDMHLREAMVLNHVMHLTSIRSTGQAIAIANRRGYLLHTEPEALALLSTEWPTFDGCQLPAPFVKALITPEAPVFAGRTLRCDAYHAAGMAMLRLRTLRLIDRLTPRRQMIAQIFANGRDYKNIARLAGISPATVRNHVRAIYADLGIRSKAQLISLLQAM